VPRDLSRAHAVLTLNIRLSPGFKHMPSQPSQELETFANPAPDRDYTIRMTLPEFTCLCPKTGQPDFATLELEYVPDRLCVELKSLKLYIWSFRNRGAFHEAVTNEIADHLAEATQPRFLRLTGRFNVRGGIYTTVVVERRQSGWQTAAPVQLP
jgi:7-cyano-7-deazaguanine reductase